MVATLDILLVSCLAVMSGKLRVATLEIGLDDV